MLLTSFLLGLVVAPEVEVTAFLRNSGELDIPRGSVRIEGGQAIFDRADGRALRLYVDCSAIASPGDFLLPVVVFFPHLFTIIRQDPQQVMVHILRKERRDGENGGS